MPTIKELKAELAKSNAKWTVNTQLADNVQIPQYRLGGKTELLTKFDKVAPINFKTLLSTPINNPYLLQRRIDKGFITKAAVSETLLSGLRIGQEPAGAPPAGGPAPAVIDWRNRFGWPWITTIRDQGGCEACWAFAAVALVEAMVRIEHCVWPHLSEGDVHKGMGAHCCDCGNPGNALNWMKDHSIADVGCYPWPANTAWCTGCGGTGGDPYNNIAYNPTNDRSGRSVRIPAYQNIGSVADQKNWLDTVGPIVTGFTVWKDFFGLGSGIYHKVNMLGPNTPNTIAGGHIMLIVGYDDGNQCWIVKNSWGATWGDHGFCRIGYGQTDIDSWAKIGLVGTNPDPWTKRRLHNGNMIESGNGSNHRNFEMLSTAQGGKIQHWWRDNSTAGLPWHKGITFGGPDVAVCPTLTGTTYNRNFESVHLTSNHRLHHWWFDQSGGAWHDGGIFGPNDAAGIPGFIQGNFGAPGNFEVVVRTADSKLNHWWRDGGGWHDAGRFGANIAYSGASLIQAHYGKQGNFELVAVTSSGQMQHFWRDNDKGTWNTGVTFGTGVASPPCMIEGQYGAANENAVGNFELCVAVGGKIQHWWRNNNGDGAWRNSATFGHDVRAVTSLVEGSFGFNLEVIVLRTDNKLQHYWRDGAGWHEGVIIGNA